MVVEQPNAPLTAAPAPEASDCAPPDTRTTASSQNPIDDDQPRERGSVHDEDADQAGPDPPTGVGSPVALHPDAPPEEAGKRTPVYCLSVSRSKTRAERDLEANRRREAARPPEREGSDWARAVSSGRRPWNPGWGVSFGKFSRR